MPKKTDKEPQPSTAPSQPSNVRSYFTSEVNEQISGMTVKEMESVLREMIGTRQWIAILKYTGMRTPLLDAQLRGTNPTLDPHKISWAQGAMAGLCDLEGYVIDLNTPSAPSDSPEEGQPDPRPDGIIVG